jgi:hypothetical protein
MNPSARRRVMRILITGRCGYYRTRDDPLFHEAGHRVGGFDTGYFCDLIEEALASYRSEAEITGDSRDIDESAFDRSTPWFILPLSPMTRAAASWRPTPRTSMT